jgi:hypothetical protein
VAATADIGSRRVVAADPLWYRVVAFAIVEENLSNNITPNKNASKKCAFAIALA